MADGPYIFCHGLGNSLGDRMLVEFCIKRQLSGKCNDCEEGKENIEDFPEIFEVTKIEKAEGENMRGQKTCNKCGTTNGVRAKICKQCNEPFDGKKAPMPRIVHSERPTVRKPSVQEVTNLRIIDMLQSRVDHYQECIDSLKATIKILGQ